MTDELIALALKLYPLLARLRELHGQATSEGRTVTDAEARATLAQAIRDLDAKIAADQAAHP